MRTGLRVERTVEGYANVIEGMTRRAEKNTVVMLRTSLDRVMNDIRRAYSDLTGSPAPPGISLSDDLPFRSQFDARYRLSDATAKYNSIIQYASGFMPDEAIAGWAKQFNALLMQATETGGKAAAAAQSILAGSATQFAGANPYAVKAATELATSFIKSESLAFRDSIAQIVSEGVSRGWGPKKLERSIRAALETSSITGDTTQRVGGMARRAQLIARNEMANAYARGAIDHNRAEGVEYVRHVAARDELTCPYCLPRHGMIYRLEEWMKMHKNCRCTPVPVSSIEVEEPDDEIRAQLAEDDYWAESRERGIKVFMKEHKLDREKALERLRKYASTPAPQEKWLYPNRTTPTETVGGPPGF
jgi:SPP1 gp7 family putative phage head morphogenesis protein